MKRLAAIFGFVMLAAPGVSNAALIQLDAIAPGDGLLTRDTNTGLEWLDLTFTVNRSFLNIDVALASDPFLSTFRRASAAEVHNLFVHAGFSSFGIFDPANIPAAQLLTSLLGDTLNGIGSRHGSIGMTGDKAPPQFSLPILTASFFTDVLVLGSLSGYALSPDGSAPDNVGFGHVGHYLVRPVAQVPEPPVIVLVVTGLVLLVRARRRCFSF